jgi:hypothetical protein
MDTKDFTTRVKGGTWMGRRLGEVLHPTQLGRPGSAPAHANKQHRQTPAATPHALFRQMAITPRIISMHQPRTQLCRHERSWDREFTHAALITRGVEMDLRWFRSVVIGEHDLCLDAPLEDVAAARNGIAGHLGEGN